jgi:succinoglycan biosynthesis protein ExoL
LPRILYLVHNLSDPAVERRIAMFRAGGAEVEIAGFRRGDAPSPNLPLDTVLELDITHDGRMLHRLAATARAAAGARNWSQTLRRPDIIVARNLEMLGVANRLLGRWDRPPRLVYECLDIHRLMLRPDGIGGIMRGIEQRLMRHVDLLITSSPAFLRNHFHSLGGLPALLVENKVFALDLERIGHNPALDGQIDLIRIGWFGALRCRKSLVALDDLTRHFGGRLGVALRGRPALTEFDDFEGAVSAAPHLQFGGPFRYPQDLAPLYSGVHFTWAIDFFEEGLNSAWLLPNRLYEGCLNGAIPIALEGTETAAFIKRLGIGIVVPDISQQTLIPLFEGMTTGRVRDLAAAVAQQPVETFRCSVEECVALVGRLLAPRSVQPALEAAA